MENKAPDWFRPAKNCYQFEEDEFTHHTKEVWDEFMEIPRSCNRLWKEAGWGLLIPISMLIGLVVFIAFMI